MNRKVRNVREESGNIGIFILTRLLAALLIGFFIWGVLPPAWKDVLKAGPWPLIAGAGGALIVVAAIVRAGQGSPAPDRCAERLTDLRENQYAEIAVLLGLGDVQIPSTYRPRACRFGAHHAGRYDRRRVRPRNPACGAPHGRHARDGDLRLDVRVRGRRHDGRHPTP